MKTHFDIDRLIDAGKISGELEYEQALHADKKLRLLAKENDHFKSTRKKLRELIALYENAEWNDVSKINKSKLAEAEKAERIAESESSFFSNRKLEIKIKLKELNLNQSDLALLLGHRSKTHMSELINGIKPFTLKDLIIIHRILKIELSILVPLYLSADDQTKIKKALLQINKPKLKLKSKDLALG